MYVLYLEIFVGEKQKQNKVTYNFTIQSTTQLTCHFTCDLVRLLNTLKTNCFSFEMHSIG